MSVPASRPRSIIWFERTQYCILGLGLVTLALTWNQQLAQLESMGRGAGFLIGSLVGGWGITLLLMWLIAYRRSNLAKWVLIGMTCLGSPFLIPAWRMLAQMGALPLAINLIQTTLVLVSIWLLFRVDSRDWFAGRRSIDPEIFR